MTLLKGSTKYQKEMDEWEYDRDHLEKMLEDFGVYAPSDFKELPQIIRDFAETDSVAFDIELPEACVTFFVNARALGNKPLKIASVYGLPEKNEPT